MAHYWFIGKNKRGSTLGLFTFILAFIVILLGAYTRLTNAGLSCPDWPNCYGYLTAPHTKAQLQQAAQNFPLAPIDVKKAWTEMTHRYFAGTEGILILILSFLILRKRPKNDIKPLIIGSVLIVLLSIQVMLGMLTVTEKLKPIIVLGHLLTGLSILSVLWWFFLISRARYYALTVNPRVPPSLMWFWLAFIVIVLQITLGGLTSTHYAGLACIDFPYCNGHLIPAMQFNLDDLITVHMLHRIGAVVAGTYLCLFAAYLLTYPSFRALAIMILMLVTLQITLGVLNILWLRPVGIAILHHAVAITLLLTIITTLVKAHKDLRDRYEFWAS